MLNSVPRLKAQGLLTLNTLMRVIDEGVVKWWNDNRVSDDKSRKIVMFPFKAEHVKDLTGTAEQRESNRIITFRKIRLAPGGMGPTPFSGVKEHRPRLRETVYNTDPATGRQTATQIKGRWRDLLIRFDCFAPSWTEATELEEDFDWLMTLFTGSIMNSGINKMIFQGSYSEGFNIETDYYYEPVTYYFRMEQQFIEDKQIIREFELNVNNVYQRIINENDSKIQ